MTVRAPSIKKQKRERKTKQCPDGTSCKVIVRVRVGVRIRVRVRVRARVRVTVRVRIKVLFESVFLQNEEAVYI